MSRKHELGLACCTTPLPRGHEGRRCPVCGVPLTGIILFEPSGRPVMDGADASDPDIGCRNCGSRESLAA